MTNTQTMTLHRIDRERRTLHATIRNRLARETRQTVLAAKRSNDPASVLKAFPDVLARLALGARLTGMRRAVLDAQAATGRDVRVAHLTLSRADDEQKERDRLLWLIAFLGLPAAVVEVMRADAARVARAAAGQIGSAAATRTIRAFAPGGVANQVIAKSIAEKERQYEPAINQRVDRPEGVRPSARSEPPIARDVSADSYESVFGRFGRANVEESIVQRALAVALQRSGVAGNAPSLIDTWAETVAYSQYEQGRWDAITNYPAYAEALWGHRWSSVLDSRTTTGCRLLDGWVAPLEDTAMRELSPPRHFNCRAVLIPVFQSSRLKRPVEVNRQSDATIARYFEEKQEFLRHLN